MAQSRFYSSTAQPTTLTSGVTPSGTTIAVVSTTGFPVNFPYVLALDYNTALEELVLVTAAAGLSLTVTRAFDGTTGASHAAGAGVRHTWAGVDGNDSRTHESLTTGGGVPSTVHGVTGAVVGTTDTQTLTNKTLTAPVINSASINNGSITGTISGSPVFSASAVALTAKTNVATDVGLVVQGVTSQSGDLVDVKDVSNNILHSIGATGATTVAPTSTSVVPLTVNAPTATTSDLQDWKVNGATQAKFTSLGTLNVTPTAPGANTNLLVNAPTGFAGLLADMQVNATSKFNVSAGGFATMTGGLSAGTGVSTQVDGSGNLTLGGTNLFGNATLFGYPGIGGINFKYKTSSTTRTNTIVRTNDPDLAWTVSANQTYLLEMGFFFDSDQAADIAFNWAFPAGLTMKWDSWGQVLSTTSTAGVIYTGGQDQTVAIGQGGDGVGTTMTGHISGIVTVGGTGGTLNFQWAQSVAQANNTTLQAGTWGRLTRVA